MKVKNIAFSGFAAMIFAGLCGAASAASVNLASKSYVDTQLSGKASIEDFENLESTVGKKATQEALKEVADQVVINTNDIALLKAAGYVSDADLDDAMSALKAVDTALQNAIDAIKNPDVDKAYVDNAISNLNTAISNLQGADVTMGQTIAGLETLVANAATKEEINDFITSSVVESKIQEAIAGLATDEEIKDFVSSGKLQQEIAKLATKDEIANFVNSTQVSEAIASATKDFLTADDIADFVKSGDVTTAIANAAKDLATKQDLADAKSELQAAIDGINAGQVELTNYYTKAQTEEKFATKAEIPVIPTAVSAFINDAGYQTATDVQGAITTAVADLATDQELANLRNALESAINEKQAKGEYLVASDLTTLNEAITALQNGKADASTVQTILNTINGLGNTYATKADMTAADAELRAAIEAINVPSLEGYVKSSDLAPVAMSGSYDDLKNKPTIPSIEGLAKTSDLEGFLTSADLSGLENAVAALESVDESMDVAIKALQGGKVSTEDLNTKVGELTAADVALKNAIDALEDAMPSVDGLVNKTYVDGLIANLELADTALQNAINAIEKPDVNKAYVDEAIAGLNTAIAGLQGADATMAQAIAGLETLVANAATKEEIKDFITSSAVDTKISEAIAGLATDEEIKDFVSSGKLQEEIAKLATKEEIANFVNSTQMSDVITNATKDLATKEELLGYVKSGDMTTAIESAIKDLATKTDLANAKSELQAAIDKINGGDVELTNYYTKAETDAKFATKDDLNAKQNTLTAGTGITISDNTISASVDTASLITKPTEQPDTFGEYVLILNINEAGESEGYSWLDTLDLIGGVEEL